MRGRFAGKYTIDETEYRKKKLHSLRETDVYKIEEEKEKEDKNELRIAALAYMNKEKRNISYTAQSEDLKALGVDITPARLSELALGFKRKNVERTIIT